MPNDKIKTYQEVITYLNKQDRKTHLLLGNGFSMAYDNTIFSYNALANFIHNINNKDLQQLFEIVNTNNFELLMQQLDNAAQIAEVFGTGKKVVAKIRQASESLKASLIDAVKELHPEHVFAIPKQQSTACAAFLNSFLSNNGQIFTTNYDLLLYWVLMRNELDQSGDGFGREAEEIDEWIEPEDRVWSELRWGKYKDSQSIHYLHGALHLFDTGIDIVKEEYTSEHYLLENIKARMDRKEYPVFVTAGSGKDKLTHIMHNKYLAYCYEEFSKITGSLICYGFSFGNYDEHIVAAINKASKFNKERQGKLFSVYIGIYSKKDIDHITKIKKKFKCKVNLFDAKSAEVWGKQ